MLQKISSKLSSKRWLQLLDMYVRKGNLSSITYDGESYKRINSGNKSITWKDGSTSPYGERKTTIDEIFEAFYLILMGICSCSYHYRGSAKRGEKN